MESPSPPNRKPDQDLAFDLERVVWDPKYRKRVMSALSRRAIQENQSARSPARKARKPS